METLVVVEQHRNQYLSRGKSNGGFGRYGSLSSPTASTTFREINCRTFQSGAGILPTPLKDFSASTIIRRSSSSCAEVKNKNSKATTPKTSPITINIKASRVEGNQNSKTTPKGSSMPNNIKPFNIDETFGQDFCFSELWAGPAYSNSPPPSSLPIPKFSLKTKRTVSLDLPYVASDLKFQPTARSAPASPTREPYSAPRNLFGSADCATKTLRRILNLDTTDD